VADVENHTHRFRRRIEFYRECRHQGADVAKAAIYRSDIAAAELELPDLFQPLSDDRSILRRSRGHEFVSAFSRTSAPLTNGLLRKRD
jgi:hypothetical protein